jgi:hypothetical protein
MLALAGVFAGTESACAQAPALAWSTNIGAQVFAVDAQTNVYAYTSNLVITVNGSGAAIETNQFCPLPALVQRDTAGNFYFAGSFDGLQDFGGITLMGGCTTCSGGNYAPGWPTCFLAKYSSTGVLQWVTQFIHFMGDRHHVDDLVLNSDGSAVVAFDGSGLACLAMFSAGGSNLWENSLPGSYYAKCAALTVSGLVGTNGYMLQHQSETAPSFVGGGIYDASGNISWCTPGPIGWSSAFSLNSRPVHGSSNNFYIAGMSFPGRPSLPYLEEELTTTNAVWDVSLGSVEQWVLAGDGGGNLYLAGTNGLFSKYDGNGSQLWTTNYGPVVVAMTSDAQGNSFLSFADGSIGRLANNSSSVVPGPFALHIKSVGSNLVLSWPSNYTGCTLEWRPTPLGSWTNVPGSPSMLGSNYVLTNSKSGSAGYYRLRGP